MITNHYGKPNGRVMLEVTGPTTTGGAAGEDHGVEIVVRDTISDTLLCAVAMTSREFLRMVGGMSTTYDAVIGSDLDRVGMKLVAQTFRVPRHVTDPYSRDDETTAVIAEWWDGERFGTDWAEWSIRVNNTHGHTVVARRWEPVS